MKKIILLQILAEGLDYQSLKTLFGTVSVCCFPEANQMPAYPKYKRVMEKKLQN